MGRHKLKYKWQWMADRILAEYQKHGSSLPAEWHKIAAAKIHSQVYGPRKAEELLRVFRRKQKQLTGGEGCMCNACVACMQAVIDDDQ